MTQSIPFRWLVFISLSLLLRLSVLGQLELLPEETYYWNYANHLDFGYLDHPPMVAYLIASTTRLFQSHEFFVRLSAVMCWLVTAYFSARLTEALKPGTGIFAVVLLSCLPFFFLHSIVITPDAPLMACWAASLYFLFQALVLHKKKAWYLAGIWLGLGLLSKYTLVLLAPSVLLYLFWVPEARPLLLKKEPYLSALLALFVFSPVIYWNATHDWASFLFQTSRRFEAPPTMTLHEYVVILLLFLMPMGLMALFRLYTQGGTQRAMRFFQIFTGFPLLFFGYFSLHHDIKFNWVGPSLLALIPWMAATFEKKTWLRLGGVLLAIYATLFLMLKTGYPEVMHQRVFRKFISWQTFTRELNAIAAQVEQDVHETPLIIPLDLYNLQSELTYYQSKLLKKGNITRQYPLHGRDFFGPDSLMYHYWPKESLLSDRTVIFVAFSPNDFNNPALTPRLLSQAEPETLWGKSQGKGDLIKPYYYQVARLKAQAK